jgi:DNA modification methylase
VIDVRVGHVLLVLPVLLPHSVHCVVTSPPYFGLRDYGTDPVAWPGLTYCPMPGTDAEVEIAPWTGSLGLEPRLEDYIGHLLLVFRGLRRVLRKDGTVWLNLGDSFAGTGKSGGGKQGERWDCVGAGNSTHRGKRGGRWAAPVSGCKSKDLQCVPDRVKLALQAEGWYVRADIPWVKRNCMPGSQRDRPTVGTERIFLLAHPESKGRYFYDQEAVKVASTGMQAGNTKATETRIRRDTDWFYDSLKAVLHDDPKQREQRLLNTPEGAPLALCVNPRPFKGAHFAVFPPTLVEPMIKASTSEQGCCVDCGAPRQRVTVRQKVVATQAAIGGDPAQHDGGTRVRDPSKGGGNVLGARTKATGTWKRTCACETEETKPCGVLDPFGGAGTTAMVAHRLGRNAVSIELGEQYADMGINRLLKATTP